MKKTLLIPQKFAVDEADELREKLNKIISLGNTDIILDFTNCTFIDSTGLGVLVSIYKKCDKTNCTLKLQSINDPKVIKIFQLTRLDQVFNL